MPVVKNPPANAGDERDLGSNPELGRSSREGNANPLQRSLAGYRPWGHKDWDMTEHVHACTCTHTHTHTHTPMNTSQLFMELTEQTVQVQGGGEMR